jgi:hypothetical protein
MLEPAGSNNAVGAVEAVEAEVLRLLREPCICMCCNSASLELAREDADFLLGLRKWDWQHMTPVKRESAKSNTCTFQRFQPVESTPSVLFTCFWNVTTLAKGIRLLLVEVP